MSKIQNWSTSAVQNKDASPHGAQDGWTGAAVGPWARETMAAVAEFHKETFWRDLTKDMSPRGTDKVVERGTVTAGVATITVYELDTSQTVEANFPIGRLVMLVFNGIYTPGFIASVSGTKVAALTVNLLPNNASGARVCDLGGVNGDSGSLLFAATSDPADGSHYANAADQFSGVGLLQHGGSTASRDLRWGATPGTNTPKGTSGILWYNTTTNNLEILTDDGWGQAGLFWETGTTGTDGDAPGSRVGFSTQTFHDTRGDNENAGRVFFDDSDEKLWYEGKTKVGAVETIHPRLSATPGKDGDMMAASVPSVTMINTEVEGTADPLDVVADGQIYGQFGGVYKEIIVKSEDIPELTNAMIVDELHGGTTPPKMTRLMLRMTNGNNRSFPVGAEVELTGSVNQSLWTTGGDGTTYYSGFAFFCDATKVYMRTQMVQWQIPDGGLGDNYTHIGRGSIITAPTLAAGGSGGNDGFELVIQLWW